VAYARGKYSYYVAHEEFAKSVTERRESWAMEKFLEALRFFESIRPTVGSDGKKVFPALYPQAVYFAGATLVRMSQVGVTSFVRGGKTIDLTQFTTSLSEMREMLMFEACPLFGAGFRSVIPSGGRCRFCETADEFLFFEPRTTGKADPELRGWLCRFSMN
jgi:hypothetical protein